MSSCKKFPVSGCPLAFKEYAMAQYPEENENGFIFNSMRSKCKTHFSVIPLDCQRDQDIYGILSNLKAVSFSSLDNLFVKSKILHIM